MAVTQKTWNLMLFYDVTSTSNVRSHFICLLLYSHWNGLTEDLQYYVINADDICDIKPSLLYVRWNFHHKLPTTEVIQAFNSDLNNSIICGCHLPKKKNFTCLFSLVKALEIDI